MIVDNNNSQHYIADDGNTFVNNISGLRYGNDLYLCDEDSIDNYTEESMNEDDLKYLEELDKQREMYKKNSRNID